MNANRPLENSNSASPDAADPLANFLAIKKQFQALEAENADWNVKKSRLKKPRRWAKKCVLAPPAAQMNAARPRGAQPGNSNRFKHGKRTRERRLFNALIRTHIQAGYALIACATPEERFASDEAAMHTAPVSSSSLRVI